LSSAEFEVSCLGEVGEAREAGLGVEVGKEEANSTMSHSALGTELRDDALYVEQQCVGRGVSWFGLKQRLHEAGMYAWRPEATAQPKQTSQTSSYKHLRQHFLVDLNPAFHR
jgi:hypothetical protein